MTLIFIRTKTERKRECEIYSLASSHWSFDQEMKDKKRVIGISCGQYKFIPFKKVPIGHLDADYLDLCIFPFLFLFIWILFIFLRSTPKGTKIQSSRMGKPIWDVTTFIKLQCITA